MCLEVFVMTDATFAGTNPSLVVIDDGPNEILKLAAPGSHAIRVGATETGCGGGFPEDGDPPSRARQALGDQLARHAAAQPLQLIIRWGGMPVKNAVETTVAASSAHRIDYEAAWHRPHIVHVLPG